MAENEELIGSFGIQDTIEMTGNQQLLNDLLAPETTVSDPEEVEPIVEQKKEVKKPVAKMPKTPVKEEEEEEKEEKEEQNVLASFLEGDDEEKEETEETVSTDATNEEEVEEASPFSSLAKDLFKLGVFTKEEGEEDVTINTPQEFLERFNSEKKKGAIEIVNNFIGQFGEDYQNMFDAVFVKGVAPQDYLSAYTSVVSFAELDMTKDSNQELVMRKTLAEQGFENDDIDSEIERLKSYGDLETVSTKHHKVLVKKEAAKLQQMEKEAEAALHQKALYKQQYAENVTNILQEKLKTKSFDGIPINPKLATELQDFLLVDKWKTNSGETLTDFDRTILELRKPENHTMKVKLALLLKIMEKDPTLSTIQKVGVSKESNELFSATARQVSKAKSTPNKSSGVSWFSNTP